MKPTPRLKTIVAHFSKLEPEYQDVALDRLRFMRENPDAVDPGTCFCGHTRDTAKESKCPKCVATRQTVGGEK